MDRVDQAILPIARYRVFLDQAFDQTLRFFAEIKQAMRVGFAKPAFER